MLTFPVRDFPHFRYKNFPSALSIKYKYTPMLPPLIYLWLKSQHKILNVHVCVRAGFSFCMPYATFPYSRAAHAYEVICVRETSADTTQWTKVKKNTATFSDTSEPPASAMCTFIHMSICLFVCVAVFVCVSVYDVLVYVGRHVRKPVVLIGIKLS